jgi:hypothetical protein
MSAGLQLRVFGSSTDVREVAARSKRVLGSRRLIGSGDGSVGRALVTAERVGDPVDSWLEYIRQMRMPSEDVMSVRLDAIGRSVARAPLSSVVWPDLLSQTALNARGDHDARLGVPGPDLRGGRLDGNP